MSSNNPTGLNPTSIKRPRSVFPINKRHITTMKIGEITPIFCEEVLPGDTFTIDLTTITRMAVPFVNPVYGDVTMSIYAFFAPNRLLWEHWHQFCGQNDERAWTQTNEYKIPQATLNTSNNSKLGQIGDHLGLPINNNAGANIRINELPLRAYARIYNEYFRNENTDDPILINYGDGENTSIKYNNDCLKAARFHDYFSNALPAPQKGEAATIPLDGTAPVTLQGLSYVPENQGKNIILAGDSGQTNMKLATTNSGGSIPAEVPQTLTNLKVDLSQSVTASINAWRLAAQTQIFLETCARYGTRYNELIYGLFGVKTGDTRSYRTEEIGEVHFKLAMQEVTATSSSADNSATEYALGQQVVKLASGNSASLFTKSFSEHGYIMIMAVPRVKHQYCQGIERKWTRETFLDFYNPIFDNIGETPVMQSEIYATADNSPNGDNASWHDEKIQKAFGYQEAWAEYRYFKDDVTGYMRPNQGSVTGDTGLPTYTFADNYTAAPTLNGFMKETRTNVQRTLALTKLEYDLMVDNVFTGKMARTMSVRSIPGLMDHHGI